MRSHNPSADAVAKIFSQCRDEVDVAWHNPDRVPYLRLQYVIDVVRVQPWNPQGPRVVVLRCGKLPAQRNEAHWEAELRQFLQVSDTDVRFQYAECVPGRCLHIDSAEAPAPVEAVAPSADLPRDVTRWMTLTREFGSADGDQQPVRWVREFPIRPNYIVQWRRDTEDCEASTSFPMADVTRRTFAQSTLNDLGELMFRRVRMDFEVLVSDGKQPAIDVVGQWQVVADVGRVSFGLKGSVDRIHVGYSVAGENGKRVGE